MPHHLRLARRGLPLVVCPTPFDQLTNLTCRALPADGDGVVVVDPREDGEGGSCDQASEMDE